MYAEISIVIRRSAGIRTEAGDESFVIAHAVFDGDDDAVIRESLLDVTVGPDGSFHDGRHLEEKRVYVEWGGSGIHWQYFVEVASHIPDVIVAAGVTKAFDAIAKHLRPAPEQVDRERAISLAKSALILNTPHLKSDSLEIVGEETDNKGRLWVFTFDPGDGWQYRAEVGSFRKIPEVTHITKTRIDK